MAVRARRALRRAQQPGVGPRPHRHDRPDDGLRHHRHRARPRARQDEEAGRRRHDVDRQPDGAAGARAARATTPARSTRSSPTSTSTSRSSGAPHLLAEHLPVFACSMGDNTIHYSGHVRMMAAVQPFISGAISKTVNMPEEATVEEVEQLHIDAWKLGVKAIAIYRDNCKVGQPLSTAKKATAAVARRAAGGRRRPRRPRRWSRRSSRCRCARSCPATATRTRSSSGWPTARASSPSASTRTAGPARSSSRSSKQGSTLAGIMDAFSISISYGLQYGVPLRDFVEAFTNTRFEPAGMTDDPDLRIATSILDYIFRRLAVDYLSFEERAELGILTTGERTQPTLPGVEETVVETRQGQDVAGRPAVDRLVVAHAVRHVQRTEGAVAARAGRRHRRREAGRRPLVAGHQAAGGHQHRRPVLHAVRRADAAGRLVPRLPVSCGSTSGCS